jgi:glutaconate CoA-transferase subunit B
VASLLPLQAIAYAHTHHAPNLTYLNCIGAINPDLSTSVLTSEDPRLLNNRNSFITLPELFDLGVRGGIDVMFFSGSQIDQYGNINLTCIGDYAKPSGKLPGPAGSSVMLKYVKRPVLFTLHHTKRTFVEQVDFITARGLEGTNREYITCVTNLGVLRLGHNAATIEKTFPWSTEQELRDNTSFPLI